MMKGNASIAAALSSVSAASLLFAACQSGIESPLDAPPAEELAPPDDDVVWPDGRFCGGIAGLSCPSGLVCEDDPDDDCDPDDGGADCGGLCVPHGRACSIPGRRYISKDPSECAAIRFQCIPGHAPFFDECGCGCEPESGVEPCGRNMCGAGEYCCNPSCGICAPIGGACILVECD